MLRIAHISDLHADGENLRPYEACEELLRLTEEAEADVLLIGGDLCVDLDVWRSIAHHLGHAPVPVAVVPGNHCLWDEKNLVHSGHRHDVALVDACSSAGIHPLWASPLLLDDVLLAGSFGHWDHALPTNDPLPADVLRSHRAGSLIPLTSPGYRGRTAYGTGYEEDLAIAAEIYVRMEEQLSVRLPDGSIPRAKVALLHTAPFQQGLGGWVDGSYTPWPSDPFMGNAALGAMLIREKVSLALFGHVHRHREFVYEGVRAINNSVGLLNRNEWAGETDPRRRIESCFRITVI